MDRKVLAVASQGGHWKQLTTLAPAFQSCQASFASTTRENPGIGEPYRYYFLPAANRRAPLHIIWLFLASAWLVARLRPDVIVSTGSLPGLACMIWGRLLGARSLWIDSIANTDRLSLSGRLARHVATMTLSQWPEIGRTSGVEYRGAIL